jgi:hypothetical protein
MIGRYATIKSWCTAVVVPAFELSSYGVVGVVKKSGQPYASGVSMYCGGDALL